jgi:fructoselysine and glucoselysine-specific PTS system IID component
MEVTKMSSKLNKKDLKQIFIRYLALNAMNDYPGQMHNGYTFSLMPAIDKIYDKEEDRIEAKKRHMEYFNITPNIAGFALGISAAMEEENAKNPDFDATSINAVKTGLMGPLSAIGDTLFPSTLRILATSLVIGMAAGGNVLAPVLFLLMYNIPNLLARWYSLKYGYSMGTEFLVKSEKSGIMDKVSYACSVVGLMAIGAMIVATVNVSTPITIGDVKNGGMVLQTTLDSIMPKMLSLGLVGTIYWLLGKGVKVVPLLIGTMVVGVILFALGIIA